MSKITIKVKRKPQKTGNIYLIRCKGEPIYVGKTIDMEKRWHEHKRDTRGPIWKHMVNGQLDDYNLEILETMPVVDKTDKKLSAAEFTHFHCFIEQGYQLLNAYIPNNGHTCDRNSISYTNHQARMNRQLPCEFCGKIGAWGHRHRHQKTSYCLNHRRLNPS